MRPIWRGWYESRGHISDKRKKGRLSPVLLSLYVHMGIRLEEKQHVVRYTCVRYTCVVKGSISSHDLWCVPSPLDWSPVHGPASLYCEAANETENNLYWTCTIWRKEVEYHMYCFFRLYTFWCQTHKKTYWHTPQLLCYFCGSTYQWHWAQTSWD